MKPSLREAGKQHILRLLAVRPLAWGTETGIRGTLHALAADGLAELDCDPLPDGVSQWGLRWRITEAGVDRLDGPVLGRPVTAAAPE